MGEPLDLAGVLRSGEQACSCSEKRSDFLCVPIAVELSPSLSSPSHSGQSLSPSFAIVAWETGELDKNYK